MQIGIDTKEAFRIHRSGIGNYVYNLVKGLMQVDNENEYYLVTPSAFIRNPFDLPSNYSFRYRFSPLNKIKQLNAFHGTAFKLNSVKAKTKVITIHDLASHLYQDFMSSTSKEVTRKKISNAVATADTIVTASNTIKNHIEEYYPRTRGRIKVVYHGIDGDSRYVEDPSKISYVRSKYKLPKTYLLYVGKLEARKNILTLLKAFKYLKTYYNIGESLLLVGKRGWGYNHISDLVKEQGLTKSVKELGWIDEEDLNAIYSAAELFVFPSWYEGFGLPVLEAMSCRLPVILSDIPTHREIANDSALYFKPGDNVELAENIISLLNDKFKRDDMTLRGLQRIKDFNWQKTAQEMIKIYEY